jgi:hypothetical protein
MFQILYLLSTHHILPGNGMLDQPMASCRESSKTNAENTPISRTFRRKTRIVWKAVQQTRLAEQSQKTGALDWKTV